MWDMRSWHVLMFGDAQECECDCDIKCNLPKVSVILTHMRDYPLSLCLIVGQLIWKHQRQPLFLQVNSFIQMSLATFCINLLFRTTSLVKALLINVSERKYLSWREEILNWILGFWFCVSVHHSISQMKHQLDAILCRFYFCRVTLHVSVASAHHQEYLKLVRRPLVHVLSLQVSHHISLLGPFRP